MGTVDEYRRRFKELKGWVLARNPSLNEEFFMDCFMGGLKLEIQLGVQELKPGNLKEMIKLARVEEAKLEAWLKRSRMVSKPGGSVVQNKVIPAFSSKPMERNSEEAIRALPIRGLTREQINEKRRLRLCFLCDEPFTPGHVCKKPRLFMMLPSEGTEEDHLDYGDENNKEDLNGECEEQEAQITLHALSGHSTNNTIRSLGMAHGEFLRILMDSGSTNNFMDPQAAKKIRVVIKDANPLNVTVADRFKVSSHQACPKVSWSVQGEEFQTDFRVLPLGGIDAVLGVQWLRLFNLVTFDFHELQLTLVHEGRTIVLQGESDQVSPTIQMMDSGEFKQVLNSATHGYFGYLFGACQGDNEDQLKQQYISSGLNGDSNLAEVKKDEQIEKILQQFASVFQEPQELPPFRTQDHHIRLKEGSQPMNIRPYRYPYVQKEEIEKIVKEMLSNGIIQASNSPYVFPVLLVKKHDGTWRMCVDYRALNSATVKDKFPIPAIDELLDELHGSNWFSKLDLRSGYHQIRVNPADIPKTTFRTHFGHF